MTKGRIYPSFKIAYAKGKIQDWQLGENKVYGVLVGSEYEFSSRHEFIYDIKPRAIRSRDSVPVEGSKFKKGILYGRNITFSAVSGKNAQFVILFLWASRKLICVLDFDQITLNGGDVIIEWSGRHPKIFDMQEVKMKKSQQRRSIKRANWRRRKRNPPQVPVKKVKTAGQRFWAKIFGVGK